VSATWSGTALVTGASRGIGRAIAVALSARVEAVVLIGRSSTDLAETARQCAGPSRCVVADLADPGERDRAFAEFADQPIGYFVHAAGDGLPAQLADIETTELDRLFRLNCAAFVHLAQLLVPGMRERAFGRVLAVGSLAPLRPQAFAVQYSATKAALRSAAQCLAVELITYGIVVNMLSPGGVETRLGRDGRAAQTLLRNANPTVASVPRDGHLPKGRLVEATDVGRVALTLLDPANDVLAGQDVVVAGTQVMR